jgi:S-formylglutathione hydrolase
MMPPNFLMQLSISYDLGIGAGFYVDATQEPYSKNYKMYTYITEGDYS